MLTAAGAILEDLDSGEVLYSKAPEVRRPIASLTKIMTAVVVLSSAGLDDVVIVPPEATGQIGSNVGLVAGERLTVGDLLYGMLMLSANDAAVALARHVGGNLAGFVRMMNEQAEAMGLRHSHFAGPSGLDNSGYSTAGDLARLTRRAYRNETFARVVATVRKRIPGPNGGIRRLVNRNILLRVYPGAIGVKSGFTTAAGFCLAGAARVNGFGLLAIVLGARTNAFDETIRLLNYGFGTFERVTLLTGGHRIGRLPPISIAGTAIDFVAARDVTTVVRKGGARVVGFTFRRDPNLGPPIVAGTRVGLIEVTLNGRLVGVVPALAAPRAVLTPSPPANTPAPPHPSGVFRALSLLTALIRAALAAFL